MGIKQVIVVRDDLKLGKGKMATHVAHASLEGYKKVRSTSNDTVLKWEYSGEKKIVLRIEDEAKLLEVYEKAKKEVPCSIIKDAGLTQIPPGTITCLVLGPWDEEIIDRFTKDLRLI
ncbi:peptidyl-tRNA hydrolase [Candidatus Micrarchaeota archaeon]|nr:peptidyl-tRNA hydrolase [Candidatus Micrarchaeota archaeon]